MENKMSQKIFEIHTVKELFDVDNFIANSKDSDYVVKIINDLDFKGALWTPISFFKGEFDGQGHIFKNFEIYSGSNIGLISRNSGYIHDISLDNTCYITGNNYVGSICGRNEGQITNCKSAATINGYDYVGGICGGCSSAFEKNEIVEESSFYGKIDANDTVGGICGSFFGRGTNLINIGIINGKNYVGGICGTSQGNLHDIKNIGSVSGKQYVGGVFGSVYQNDFENVENYGAVKGHFFYGNIYGNIYKKDIK
jgi:hypothetical protein